MEVLEEEDLASNKLTASDIPFDIEEGDRVWATGLIPEAQYVQEMSTISQRLVGGFAKNAEANPTLLIGGRGLGDSVLDYVKIFGQKRICEAPELKTLGSYN